MLYQLSYDPLDLTRAGYREGAPTRMAQCTGAASPGPNARVGFAPWQRPGRGAITTMGAMPAPRRVSARIGAIAESATLAVDARAKALKAAGRPVIGFGAGEPDFPTPDYIVEAAVAACRDPRWHRYTPAGGLPELKEAVAAKTYRDSGLVVKPSHVLITNGGKQALYNAFAALLDPGDEVLLPAPYWTTYPESIALAGGTTVVVPTSPESGYRATIDELEAARTPHTKALVFVSPSNPTGAVYSPEDVAAIGRWAVDHGIWVVTDEIYEHLVYGDAEFASMPVEVPELVERCIVVNGVAKTYAMTGWRVGWLIGPDDIVKAATNLQSHATSNVANVSQIAALAAVSGDLAAVAEMKVAFDRRRRRIVELLGSARRHPPSWRRSSSTRWRSRSSRARRSGPRGTCGCPTRWVMPTSRRAWLGWPPCSARRPEGRTYSAQPTSTGSFCSRIP